MKTVAEMVGVSASMALVATNAMAAMEKDQAVVDLDRDFDISEELALRIDEAVAKKSVRDAVSSVFGELTRSFAEDGKLLSDRYVLDGVRMAAEIGGDSTGTGACYANCYSNCHGACYHNCHGACHGARGWR